MIPYHFSVNFTGIKNYQKWRSVFWKIQKFSIIFESLNKKDKRKLNIKVARSLTKKINNSCEKASLVKLQNYLIG